MDKETEQIFILNSSKSQMPVASHKLPEAAGTPPSNLRDVEDFSTVCRTCATVTEFVMPIFDGEGLQNNLAEKICKHLPIQVCETDVLPRVVCYQCASTLLAWHELVQCCVQADAALRTRLAVADALQPKEPEPRGNEIFQNIDQQEQIKFIEIEEYVVQTLEPPQYEAAPPGPPGPSPPAARSKTCAFCGAAHAEHAFREHLVAAHSDLLFHCDECDTYVDRRDFILHMSSHAVEYATKQEKMDPKLEVKREKKMKIMKKKKIKDENQNENARKVRKPKGEADAKPTGVRRSDEGSAAENEFSDHSDTENGFGPLPESVFEAIEDSQDSQPETAPAQAETDAPAAEPDVPRSHKKPRTCPLCGKVYNASSSYFYHMKHFHRRAREHECAACGKRFGTRAALDEHGSVHSGESLHACATCGKRFRSRAGLYIHAQTHSGVKAWACACGQRFRWRTHLARHAARHADRRAHACADCPRAFSVRADLLRHARTHARRALACPHCAATFAQERYLKVHVERKHPAAASMRPPLSTDASQAKHDVVGASDANR